jgi:hypothetical protein
MPRDLRPAGRTLAIVCGPPAAGKTTWARGHAEHVIDLDEIVAELSGYPLREAPVAFLARGLARRNEMLRECAFAGLATAFIVSAPEAAERAAWRAMLAPARIVVIDPGEDICRTRIVADPGRAAIRRTQITAMRRWYALYSHGDGEETIGVGERPASRLHSTARWQRRRAAHLREEPLCRYCRRLGVVNDGSLTAGGTPQTKKRRRSLIVDHIEPHHGDPEKFWTGELQTLCADHHDAAKQAEEHRSYSVACGLDGKPLDRNHPGLTDG